MVSVVVHAPLDVDNLTRGVSGHGAGSPASPWLIVVNTDTGIVAARTASSNLGLGYVGPSRDRLKDGTFGTCIDTSLQNRMLDSNKNEYEICRLL